MEEKYCQSCAMPMGDTDEMIEVCVPHMVSANSGMSEEEARNMMREFFPTLKRWKKA